VSTVLAGLTAPPILRPSLDAQRHEVARSSALCATIRSTLLRRDIPAANAAIHSLFTVSATLNGAGTKNQQAAAARAYDARLQPTTRGSTRSACSRSGWPSSETGS
jgi:hypothetical protein